MNISYFRKTNLSAEEVLSKLKEESINLGYEIKNEDKINNGYLLTICKKEWLEKVLNLDNNLIGVLPCFVLITEKNGETLIGSGNPAILSGVSINQEVIKLAQEAEKSLKRLINTSSGLGELKIKNLKLYSTQTCPYCNMEKAWLNEKNIKHEVIYLETNQEAAKYMVEKTGQMGVPVTEIEYEGSDSEFIVGFNKQALEQILK